MQRIVPKQKQTKGVILFMHGFCQNSESFVSRTDPKNSLPIALAEDGYDVFLGNIRGNKYCFKHRVYSPSDTKFWDFSLDDYAQYDLPAIIKVRKRKLYFLTPLKLTALYFWNRK